MRERGRRPEPDDGAGHSEADYADVVRRLSSGGHGIRPRPDAPTALAAAVARDRRRRRTRTNVTLAAAATVVVAASVTALLTVGRPDDGTATPTAPSSDATEEVTAARPASLFQSVVGGRSRGKSIRYHLVPGERLNAQFDWWPEETGGPGPYLAGVAVENYPEATTDCATVVVGGSPCVTRDDGVRLTTYDVPLADAFLDPVHQAATFEGEADPAAVVRGVTYLYPGGIAVSAYVCACSPAGVANGDAPLSYDDLEQIALDAAWVPGRPTG